VDKIEKKLKPPSPINQKRSMYKEKYGQNSLDLPEKRMSPREIINERKASKLSFRDESPIQNGARPLSSKPKRSSSRSNSKAKKRPSTSPAGGKKASKA
jgi:hypothetical protein